MLLDPGPLPVLQPSTAAIGPEAPQFAALASTMLAGAADLESWLTLYTDGAAQNGAPVDFIDMVSAIDAVDTQVHAFDAVDPLAQASGTDGSLAYSEQSLAFFNADAPAEIYQPVPDPTFIPGSSGVFPGINGPTTIAIDNLSVPGATSFKVGDQYQIVVNVSPGGGAYDYANVDIWLIVFKGGAELPVNDIGNTDAFGRVVYRSTWQTGQDGTYHIYPLPLGAGTNPALDFTVAPAPQTPPTPPPPVVQRSITLLNVYRGDNTFFRVGDVFEIDAIGAVGEAVAVHGTLNNVPQGTTPVVLGVIGSNGTFKVQGTIDNGSVGFWTEQYYIGGFAVGPLFQFTVT